MSTTPSAAFSFLSPSPAQERFAHLGPAFYTALQPTPLPAPYPPYWVGTSLALARELGLGDAWLSSNEALQALSGNALLSGSVPYASVYSGHQFGVWAGQLGDGRAICLGEQATAQGRLEWQLKGAGRTPYSRGGDGRAVLRSSIREFLCSEAMHALGIATTRALCVTGSDAPIQRETLETAAVVTRVAPSFVRFGHFEHFAYTGQHGELKALADYTIARFYPMCAQPTAFGGNPYAALLQAVSERTACMVAQWQAVGFCHGVMNTDNMSILGLTIDYGPFQFLDAFVPSHICNHSDTQGRYAYNRQPNIAYWNLFCLGQALMPLLGEANAAQELALSALESYKSAYPQALQAAYRAKLGLVDVQETDMALIEGILKLLATERVDYSIFWRRLSEQMALPDTPQPSRPISAENPAENTSQSANNPRDLFLDRRAFDAWSLQYSERSTHIQRASVADLMLKTNPKYLLRNHLGEKAIQAAKLKDFSEVNTLLTLLQNPFEEHPAHASYADFPPSWAASIEISCSS